jgi:proteasome accessory factor B
MKLSRISRIVRILTTLQSGHSYSPEELTELVGVSRRTVFRDLKELSAIGVPYRFDKSSGGYMIEPEFFLPSVDLNLQEALSLLLLIHKGRTHLPIPFKNSALLAGIKVENNLPEKIRQYCSATLANISIRPDRHAPMDLLDRIFSQLQNAIRTRRKINLSYHSLYEQADIATVLSPYHLTYHHRAWYILGHSSIHKSTRTFKLNRIKKLELLEKRFVKDEKFDIHNYLGRAWSMIPEGKMYNIELCFSKKVAKNVAEVQWHSTQKNYFNGDGSLTVSFRVDGLGEISWWILGYGDQVEVVAPAALRKKIATTAQLVVDKNTS